jgi:uncharacterized phosphosugar-binding protein
MIVVMSLHDASVARGSPSAMVPVNVRHARQAWRQHITRLLDEALESNGPVLDEVAAAMAVAIGSGRDVYAFGAGHSISLVMEMHHRAGGLKVVRPIWNDKLTSRSDIDAAGRLESTSGYYRELTGNLDWGPGDLCWVISNSGRNALVVELAQEAKRHGVAVIALTSVGHSTAVPPVPGLPRLLEIADYVLDNAGRYGDASLGIPGLDEPMAPTSTVVGAALIHAAWAGTAERLIAAGHVPEVWGSANRGPAAASPTS